MALAVAVRNLVERNGQIVPDEPIVPAPDWYDIDPELRLLVAGWHGDPFEDPA